MPSTSLETESLIDLEFTIKLDWQATEPEESLTQLEKQFKRRHNATGDGS